MLVLPFIEILCCAIVVDDIVLEFVMFVATSEFQVVSFVSRGILRMNLCVPFRCRSAVAPDSLSSSTRRPHQRCWSLNHSLICAGFLPVPRLSGKKACTSHRMKRGRRTRPHSRSPHPSPCIHLSLSSRVDLSQSLVPPLRLPLFVFYLSSDCWISSPYVAIDRPLKLHL